MSGFQEPKLIEESRYDSHCALCQNEIPKGAPLWWFNQNCYCMEHSKAEIRTEGAAPSVPANNPSPCGPPSTLIDDLRELCRAVERCANAIDTQTEVLKGMRKDNNERR